MITEPKTKKLKALADAYKEKLLRVNPEYQRGLQWGVQQKQGLIDSLLRGYQIPIFYIHIEESENSYTGSKQITAWIVDGQQRLSSIVDYLENKFTLPDPRKAKIGTTISSYAGSHRWDGKKFSELDQDLRNKLMDVELLVVEMKAGKNEVRDLFIRLQGGTPLTAQEKRDAWPGDFTNFVIQHAGKPGHPKSMPHVFFDIFKKSKKEVRISVADGEHYIDGHAETRKFFAGLAMTVMLRETNGIDFVDLKGKTINEFYLKCLDLDADDIAPRRVIGALDAVVALPSFNEISKYGQINFQLAFHLLLVVDSLRRGNFSNGWMQKLIPAFNKFRADVNISRQEYRENKNLLPHYEKFVRLLSGSGSDVAEVIRARHAFMLSELYPLLGITPKDDVRIFDQLSREIIYSRDNGRCQCPTCVRPDCRVGIDEAHMHHITEHSIGGRTVISNGITICPECHSSRVEMQGNEEYFKKYILKVSGKKSNLIEGASFNDEQQSLSDVSRISILIKWGELDVDLADEVVCEKNDAETIAAFLSKLIRQFGSDIRDQLITTNIIRFPLSRNPDFDFLNKTQGKPYSYTKVPGTELYFCAHSDRETKIKCLNNLFQKLTLPDGSELSEDSIIVSKI